MTIFDEKVRALKYAREFLRELALPNRLTKKQINERALSVLRHFPFLAVDVKVRDDKGKWQRIEKCIEDE